MPDPNNKITLRLADIRDLFVAPQLDPFASQEVNFTGQSGLERVVRQLEERSIKERSLILTVVLPKTKITPDLPTQIHQAMERYARIKTEENLQQLKSLRQQGWQSLGRGLVFLGVCTGLSTLLQSPLLDSWTPFVRSTLSEGLTVIGWVALWHPFEALVYDPVPIKKENQVYTWLRRIQIKIQGEN